MTIAENEPRKYKINQCLIKLPIGQHREAVRLIPRYMKISLNTFHNYRNIRMNDRQDIPHEKVVLFERLFELKPGELLNRVRRTKTLKELIGLEGYKGGD